MCQIKLSLTGQKLVREWFVTLTHKWQLALQRINDFTDYVATGKQ